MPVWDTSVADSLLRGCHHNKSRGLALVLHDYTGHTINKDFDTKLMSQRGDFLDGVDGPEHV